MKKESQPEPTQTIHLVPHNHYDVVWAFSKEDYLWINETILKAALKMVEERDYRFLIEQAFPLQQMAKRDPDLFARVTKAVAAGKIEIVDGQYLMPDPMIPSGETLVREILHGKRYFLKQLGVDIPVAWAADGFGLNAQMPQIYKKSGYRWLAFRRGLPKAVGARVSEFLWQGLDGTKILTHWMPRGYRAGLDPEKWEEALEALGPLAASSRILMPCGSGGVPPQEEIPERVAQWNKTHPNHPMVISTPSDFFKALDTEAVDLTVYEGEMYSQELEHIFPDAVSSRIRLKLAIRDTEDSLLFAEKMVSQAWLEGRAYPFKAFKEMWKGMLFLANHDVLPAVGTDQICKEAWHHIREIQRESVNHAKESIRFLVGEKQARSQGHIAVHNPNNWRSKNWVEVEVDLPEGRREEALGLTHQGTEVPSQILDLLKTADGTIQKAKIGFVADVPSFGCSVYALGKQKRTAPKSRIQVNGNRVITPFFTLGVDEKTGILHVQDKTGKEILTGNELIIDEELGDLYFHRSQLDKLIGSESGEGIHFSCFKPEGLEIRKGALKTEIWFKNAFYCLRWPYYLTDKFDTHLHRNKTITLTKRVIVYNDIPRIDFITHLDNQQPHIRLRLKFDTGMVSPTFTRETQFGALELPKERTQAEGMKAPSLAWVAGEEGKRGVALMTLGVPINEIKRGEIYCTLLRSVAVLCSNGKSGPLIPTPEALELGSHTFVYSAFPYAGDWKQAQVHRQAYDFHQHLFATSLEKEPKRESVQHFTLEPDNLIVSAMKLAEEEDGLILRFFEAKGERSQAKLTLPPCVESVKTVNLLEAGDQSLPIHKGHVELAVGPFEIITLKLQIQPNRQTQIS